MVRNVRCCVPRCGSILVPKKERQREPTQGGGSGENATPLLKLSFHRFPSDGPQRSNWIAAIQKVKPHWNLNPNDTKAVVCSRHFDASVIAERKGQRHIQDRAQVLPTKFENLLPFSPFRKKKKQQLGPRERQGSCSERRTLQPTTAHNVAGQPPIPIHIARPVLAQRSSSALCVDPAAKPNNDASVVTKDTLLPTSTSSPRKKKPRFLSFSQEDGLKSSDQEYAREDNHGPPTDLDFSLIECDPMDYSDVGAVEEVAACQGATATWPAHDSSWSSCTTSPASCGSTSPASSIISTSNSSLTSSPSCAVSPNPSVLEGINVPSMGSPSRSPPPPTTPTLPAEPPTPISVSDTMLLLNANSTSQPCTTTPSPPTAAPSPPTTAPSPNPLPPHVANGIAEAPVCGVPAPPPAPVAGEASSPVDSRASTFPSTQRRGRSVLLPHLRHEGRTLGPPSPSLKPANSVQCTAPSPSSANIVNPRQTWTHPQPHIVIPTGTNGHFLLPLTSETLNSPANQWIIVDKLKLEEQSKELKNRICDMIALKQRNELLVNEIKQIKTESQNKILELQDSHLISKKGLKQLLRNQKKKLLRNKQRLCLTTNLINELKSANVLSSEAARAINEQLAKCSPGAAEFVKKLITPTGAKGKKMKKWLEQNSVPISGPDPVSGAAESISDGPCSSSAQPPLATNAYSAAIRTLALTIHFYSPAAYRYMRDCFDKNLPSERTMRGWLSHIDAEPGWTHESISALQHHVKACKEKGKTLHVAIVADDMSLREHLESDGRSVVGYVDMGSGTIGTDEDKAKHAFVIMAVGINDNFKIPLGYFFIRSLTGADRSTLMRSAILTVEDCEAQVDSITFDGTACNIAMARDLGAHLEDFTDFIPSFPNPADKKRRINVILDPAHMLKLIRNTLAERGVLYDHMNRTVEWRYIQALVDYQSEIDLHLANRARKTHIDWKFHKMNVRVAAQTLSRSVARAIRYCMEVLKREEFKGAEATIEFIEYFDELFDLLNSSSPVAKGLKAPLRASNFAEKREFMLRARSYILDLSIDVHTATQTKRELVIKSDKKTGFLGMLVAMQSLTELYTTLVVNGDMVYILAYKFSQDHIEIFFGCIRQRGGWNVNPTCRQFKAAYKRLLIHNEIRSSEKGNCINVCHIKILRVSSVYAEIEPEFDKEPSQQLDKLDTLLSKLRSGDVPPLLDDRAPLPGFPALPEAVGDIVEYIAGWVTKSLAPRINCVECREALYGTEEDALRYRFLRYINDGGLSIPSLDVVRICKFTEQCFREVVAPNLNKVFSREIPMLVKRYSAEINLFSSLEEHARDCRVMESHVLDLTELVSKRYLRLRIHHAAKQENAKKTSERTYANRILIERGM